MYILRLKNSDSTGYKNMIYWFNIIMTTVHKYLNGIKIIIIIVLSINLKDKIFLVAGKIVLQ